MFIPLDEAVVRNTARLWAGIQSSSITPGEIARPAPDGISETAGTRVTGQQSLTGEVCLVPALCSSPTLIFENPYGILSIHSNISACRKCGPSDYS